MAYGFEVLNSNGNVVLNDKDSPLRLVRERTLSSSKVVDVPGISPAIYEFTPTVYAEAMLFVNLPNGADLAYHPPGKILYSTRSTITLRECSPFIERAPVGQGYGMEIFDEAGSLVYSTAGDLVPIGKYASVVNESSNTSIASDDAWVCLVASRPMPVAATIPPYGSGVLLRYLGIKRTSNTNIRTEAMSVKFMPGATMVGTSGLTGATRFVTAK